MALATFLNPFSPKNPSGPLGIPTKVILFGAQTNPGLQFFVIEDPRNPPLCHLGAPFPIWARPGVPGAAQGRSKDFGCREYSKNGFGARREKCCAARQPLADSKILQAHSPAWRQP